MEDGSQLSPQRLRQYQELLKRAKEEARSGALRHAVQILREAQAVWPSSSKVSRRIERLEKVLQEIEAQGEEEEGQDEEEEFTALPDSGLLLYRPLYLRLYPHQRQGVAFLHRLHRDGLPGGILADDMGLGKTVQLIAFLSGMFDAELVRCCLLVLPSGLLRNWAAEFSRWTPGLRVREFHGTKAERTRNLERVQRRAGVVITTYQMVINNWQQLSSLVGGEFTWDYLVLDEAHKIKSKSTKTFKCVSAIPAKHRILLTGTPVQNNLQEMWSLFDFACQGSLLGTAKTFKMQYENPITRAREKDATPAEKALGLRISENLMRIIEPYFLRRTKENVQLTRESSQSKLPSSHCEAQMPILTRKNDLIVWVYLSCIQEEIYQKFVSSDHIQELLQTRRSPLVQLTNLKKLCDHPRLLSRRICEELGLGGCEGEAVDNNALSDISCVPDEDLISESGKLVFLLGLLEKLREEGKRTLVFSQSRKMLDIIQRILTNRSFPCMRLDGTMALPDRQKKIKAFQQREDHCVFLLTTQVGGVGLTLTAANRVVVFDPSWNPATDAQAVDRAYRIGQTDNVVIYRLVTCGTVEEKIYRRQIFKDSLVRQSVGEKKNPFRYFSSQELRELFILEDPRASSTQRQLQSMHASQRRTDSILDQHLTFLHTLEMFGVTDHDLIFSQDTAPDEENDPESRNYIQQRVQKAQELVAAESQLQQQLVENIRANTEAAWLNRPRDTHPLPGSREGCTRPKPVSTISTLPALNENTIAPRSPAVTVDLTEPVDNEMANEVLNLSSRLADMPIETSKQSHSVVMLDSSLSHADSNTAEEEQFPTECQGDTSKTELSTTVANSPDSRALFESKSDFNLILEETMEEDEEVKPDCEEQGPEAEPLPVTEPKSGGDMEAARSAEQQGEHPASPGGTSLGDDSCILQPWKKPHGQVIISDSEEETNGDLHSHSALERPPALSSTSPELQAFCVTAASTPKGSYSPLPTLLDRSSNRSVASRRSAIGLAIDDVDDLDEEIPDHMAAADGDDNEEEEEEQANSHSDVEGEGETDRTADPSEYQPGNHSMEEASSERQSPELGAASSDEGVSASCSMMTGSEEEQSGTFEPELGSDEQVETYTKVVEPSVLDTRALSKDSELDQYTMLVKRGREHIERGELKSALNCMLEALDLRSGDPEVQLITIKLYRQLDQS
ncbi:DNA excision repair protein ERCC-6-like isoform X1 [Rhincodon typus]|uniref:DNA excision repair protein ERCC-6-like isoform X1 n=1 Tax=Rhincodon typus TaxID=259920 RepID=UPI002030D97B|nr:DNA excision repair protein ERCC-6-like isoform X1 [Rhincodon typus]